MRTNNDGRRRGTLDRWNDDRGFGFVSDAETGEKLYVHASWIEDDGRGVPKEFKSPREGVRVTFVRHERMRGPTAQDVRVETW
jgi:cold shock CspA family protein